MTLIAVGTNHKASPIEIREKISFSGKGLKNALLFLKEEASLEGAVILSTCNRVEIYASASDAAKGIEAIERFITRYHEIKKEAVSPYLYIYEGEEAIRHLYDVACGLDSLIMGEREIMEQVGRALVEAEEADAAGETLSGIFSCAVSFARRMHNEGMAQEPPSAGSAAIDFIKERLGPISDKNILIIGTGKVTESVLRRLERERPSVVFLSNRTFEKAQALARKIGAKAARFDELKEILKTSDILITATRSPHFIIRKETLEGLGGRRIFIIDLAVPRDVDPRVRELENIDLFYLEDLGTARRSGGIEKWRRFIESEQEKALSLLSR